MRDICDAAVWKRMFNFENIYENFHFNLLVACVCVCVCVERANELMRLTSIGHGFGAAAYIDGTHINLINMMPFINV